VLFREDLTRRPSGKRTYREESEARYLLRADTQASHVKIRVPIWEAAIGHGPTFSDFMVNGSNSKATFRRRNLARRVLST
jgi:hypothetical protein